MLLCLKMAKKGEMKMTKEERDEELKLMIDTKINGEYDAQFYCNDDGQNETVKETVELPWKLADEFDTLEEMVKSLSHHGGFCDFQGGNFFHAHPNQ